MRPLFLSPAPRLDPPGQTDGCEALRDVGQLSVCPSDPTVTPLFPRPRPATSPPSFCFLSPRTSANTTPWRGGAGGPVNHGVGASRLPDSPRSGRGTESPPRHSPATLGGEATGPGRSREPPTQDVQARSRGCSAQKTPAMRNAWGQESKQQGHVPQRAGRREAGAREAAASLDRGGNSQIRPRYCCF